MRRRLLELVVDPLVGAHGIAPGREHAGNQGSTLVSENAHEKLTPRSAHEKGTHPGGAAAPRHRRRAAKEENGPCRALDLATIGLLRRTSSMISTPATSSRASCTFFFFNRSSSSTSSGAAPRSGARSRSRGADLGALGARRERAGAQGRRTDSASRTGRACAPKRRTRSDALSGDRAKRARRDRAEMRECRGGLGRAMTSSARPSRRAEGRITPEVVSRALRRSRARRPARAGLRPAARARRNHFTALSEAEGLGRK